MNKVFCKMGVEIQHQNCALKFLKNSPNDTDVAQQKFISQLVIQEEKWMHNFDSESEQQSMHA